MGGEWSKAVKIIFNKKYSNGRGKLADAMKDPETKALHSSMLGKKPMKPTKFMKVKNTNFKKTQKFKKGMRGGVGPDDPVSDEAAAGVGNSPPVSGEAAAGVGNSPPVSDEAAAGVGNSPPVSDEEVTDVGTGPTAEGKASTSEPTSASIEERVSELENTVNAMRDDKLGTTSKGGKKSKKNRSNKIKDKKGKSFRKKCGW